MAQEPDKREPEAKSGGLAVERVRPAYDQVAAQLRELIVRGDVAPNERLPPEGELAKMFGVSRSTAREALRVLSSQGLIVTNRGTSGGSFVASPDPHHLSQYLEAGLGLLTQMAAVDVTKLLEARELLETPAAGLAAVRRTPEQLETLRATLSDAGQEADRVQLYEQNKLFHTTILEAADNPLLQLMTQPVFAVVRARFLPAISPESFWPRVDCDHRTIFDAIERGDRNAAEDAMRVHLAHLGSTYEGIEPKTPIGD